ncbi:MAG: peptide chain release factor 1 [Candidatus Omnitrophota bacterium]|jgi:peptide chain release factor 1
MISEAELDKIEQRYSELETLVGSPEVISDTNLYTKYAKELSKISNATFLYRQLKKQRSDIAALERSLKEKNDPEYAGLVEDEIRELKAGNEKILEDINKEFGPKEEQDRNIIIEIRAGTGGQEASLFVADLYRMYTQYAAGKGWEVEALPSHPTELGGYKEVVFAISGKGAYKSLKFESGVHRVQRVPETEAQGRIHTSTVTVAVLTEPEEVDLVIDPKDLKIDVYRASGKGGQSVNTADSAVRITHLPTGLVVTCQDERSQLKNKNKGMRVLAARLLERKEEEEFKKVSQERKSQIGSGDRSEKIRTYNFPDRRVTDHRIGLTIHQLEAVLDGDLDELVQGLIEAENRQKGVA